MTVGLTRSGTSEITPCVEFMIYSFVIYTLCITELVSFRTMITD